MRERGTRDGQAPGRWIREAGHDCRYAIRLAVKSPGFTLAATLILALGIGANTAVFSIVDAVLLRPLPYQDPDRLVAIWNRNTREQGPSKLFDAYADFAEYARSARSFDSVAAATWAVDGQVLTGRGPAREVLAIPVSASFFTTLGVEAALGRTFEPADERQGCAVVLTDRFWRSTMHADAGVVGQSVALDRRSCTVLGVMPPSFSFYPGAAHMWMLLGPDFRPPRAELSVGIFARLRPGVTRAQAEAETTALYRALHHDAGIQRDLTPVVYGLKDEFTWLTSRTLRSTLMAVSAAVASVLFIACLNVASLLIGRALARDGELAVRAALGAGRHRIVRQLLTEGFLLSVCGSALGVALAVAAVRYLRHASPIELPVGADISLHGLTLLFTAALSVVTTLAFALVPAVRASRVDVSQGLKLDGRGSPGGRSRGRLVGILLVAEMAVSITLLVGAALLIQSVARMRAEPLGFDPEGLLTTNISLPAEDYPDATRQLQFSDAFEHAVSAIPGVTGVALSWTRDDTRVFQIDGDSSGAHHTATIQAMTPRSLATLRLPLLRGRGFDERDGPNAEPVALINDAFARRFFAAGDPIGRRIRLGDAGTGGPWLTIVGTTGNIKQSSLFEEMSWQETPAIYRPFRQEPQRRFAAAIRTAEHTTEIGRAVHSGLAALDPSIPIGEIESMAAALEKDLAYPRFRARVFGAFAVAALILAAVGVYGVLGQFVAQRRREFAVRMAIGASRRDIVLLVAWHGGVAVAVGVLAGLVCASAGTRVLSGLLYGVTGADPLLLGTMSLTLLAVAAASMALPARRAATVDPMVALRDE